MSNIMDLVNEIKLAGADAVCRYVKISGQTPLYMPELFVAPYIFDKLGDRFTFTLESSVAKLIEFDNESNPNERSSDEGKTEIKRWRSDMVVYDGRDPRKDEQPPYAIIEFKKGYISDEDGPNQRSDLSKLKVLLQYIRVCKYGAMAAAVPEWERDKKKEKASKCGDTWIEQEIINIPNSDQKYFFCIWMMEKGVGSLANL